mmetsp:Transcript_1748/g.2828  ORF Transcript_1748/g.2828 Transcript_1748/m.2828 type:complete len:101 (+) Transcript_1748:8021-8323(+)
MVVVGTPVGHMVVVETLVGRTAGLGIFGRTVGRSAVAAGIDSRIVAEITVNYFAVDSACSLEHFDCQALIWIRPWLGLVATGPLAHLPLVLLVQVLRSLG